MIARAPVTGAAYTVTGTCGDVDSGEKLVLPVLLVHPGHWSVP